MSWLSISIFLHVAGHALRRFLLTSFMVVVVPLGIAYGDEVPVAPPYLVAGADHVVVGVVWDEAAIRKALPSWLTPTKDMTGVIDISQTAEVYGLAPYHAAYFAVDLEGLDSSSGVKARWMLQGVYGPQEEAAGALEHWYGLPVRTGTSRFEPTSEGKRAVAMVDGQDLVTVEIKYSDACGAAAVTFNYVTPEGLIEIAFAGSACKAEPVSVEVHAPPGAPFAAFQPIKVLWAAEYKDGSFAITRAIPLYH